MLMGSIELVDGGICEPKRGGNVRLIDSGGYCSTPYVALLSNLIRPEVLAIFGRKTQIRTGHSHRDPAQTVLEE